MTVSGAFGSHLDTILHVLRCQCKEVLSVLTSSYKEVISFLTSYCKEVLVPYKIQVQATSRSRKKLLACRGKKTFLQYTHGTHASLMRMNIVPTTQISAIIHKTGLDIDESKVLVLSVYLRDGGNLPLSGSIVYFNFLETLDFIAIFSFYPKKFTKVAVSRYCVIFSVLASCRQFYLSYVAL